MGSIEVPSRFFHQNVLMSSVYTIYNFTSGMFSDSPHNRAPAYPVRWLFSIVWFTSHFVLRGMSVFSCQLHARSPLQLNHDLHNKHSYVTLP